MMYVSRRTDEEYVPEPNSEDEQYITYNRNGFCMYTNTNKNLSNKMTDDSVTKKRFKMRYFILQWIKEPYVNSMIFNDRCDKHTKTDKKLDLIRCVNYAEENKLDIIIPKIQAITSSSEDLDVFWEKIFKRDVRIFIPREGQRTLQLISIFEYLRGEYLFKMIKINKKMKYDYDVKRSLDKLDTIGTVKTEKIVIIGSEELRVVKENICKRWIEIYSLLGEIGAYDWVCDNTGGEEDWDKINVKKWKKTATELSKIFVTMNRFSLWGTKLSITPSIVIRIKKNCSYGYKHLSDLFKNRNTKTMLEVDLDVENHSERRINQFSEQISGGKCDDEEKGLFVREMYPEWYMDCKICGKSFYKKRKLKGKCNECTYSLLVL